MADRKSNVVPFKPRDPAAARITLEAAKALTLKHHQETVRFYMACGMLLMAGLAANGAILLWAAGCFR